MIRHLKLGPVVPVVAGLALLLVGAPSGAQPPSGDEARKLLGPGGGTILVYEMQRSKAGAGQHHPSEEEKRHVATALQRALKQGIDPNDLYDIAVRPAGKDRIEVI